MVWKIQNSTSARRYSGRKDTDQRQHCPCNEGQKLIRGQRRVKPKPGTTSRSNDQAEQQEEFWFIKGSQDIEGFPARGQVQARGQPI